MTTEEAEMIVSQQGWNPHDRTMNLRVSCAKLCPFSLVSLREPAPHELSL
jgi:hypothetical protein